MEITFGNLIKFVIYTAIGVLIIKLLNVQFLWVLGAFVLSIFLIITYLKSQTYRRRAELMLYFALFWAVVAFPYIVPYVPFFTGISAAIIAGAVTFLIIIIALLIIGNKIRD